MSRLITVERSYRATLDEVWELWTTKDGIEAWWGPHGFRVEVTSLKVETGGHMKWAMIADAPEMVAFMKKEQGHARTEHRNDFTEVVPKTRLAWRSQADFIPGVKPYPLDTRADFEARGDEVRVSISFTPMHDETWSWRAKEGWTQELERLQQTLTQRRSTS